MGGGIEQPIGDFAVLFGAMKLRACHKRKAKQRRNQGKAPRPHRSPLHGSLRAVIFTGNWSSRSFKKLKWTRPSDSVETMAGDALPIGSQPAGRITTLRLIPSGPSKNSKPSFSP